jgi:hypothetical protein
MTNAQSKHQDANAQTILKNAVLSIHELCERDNRFSLLTALKRNGNDDRVVLLDNPSYFNLHKWGRERHSVRGSDGVMRNYIYDEKDGIYKTKLKTHILAPHILIAYQLRMTFGITTDMKKYWNMYSGKERFDQESFIARQKNHTGNHHRNKMINVPKSAYGMK